MIARLEEENPELFELFLQARRFSEGQSHLVRDSGRYPLCGRGDVNTYSVFAELNRSLISSRGRVGCIVPTGIATDDTTKSFFQDLIKRGSLVSLYSFFETRRIFIATDSRNPFCLLTLRQQSGDGPAAEFAFDLRSVSQLQNQERRFTLSASDIALLNPNTRTCPIFRSRRDAEITKHIYERVPVLIKEGPPVENPWGVSFLAMFHMTNDSGLFRTRDQLEQDGWRPVGNRFTNGADTFLPLYEAKMIHHFNHRFGDYADKPDGSLSTALPEVSAERMASAEYFLQPRYWVPETEVGERLPGSWGRNWFLGWRDIGRSTDERTVISAVIPRSGVGNNLPLAFSVGQPDTHLACLNSCLASIVFDFVARFKVGGTHLNYFIVQQLPVLPPRSYEKHDLWCSDKPLSDWILARTLELTYTAWDLQPFAQDCGYDGPPFRWDESRRFLLRCELDAAFFHLYGIERDDVDYIMETFPIVKRKDVKEHGDYRTKLQILAIYDAMQRAMETGEPYQTLLDPPPADPRVAHPPREERG